MTTPKKIAFAVLFSLIVGGLLVWPGLGGGQQAEDDSPDKGSPGADKVAAKDPPKDRPKPEKPSSERTKPDLPRVDKGKAPRGKAISLAEAIIRAEELGKGMAVKAERKDRPVLSFKVDVLAPDGGRIKIELSADGKLLTKKEERKEPEEREGKKRAEKK